MREAAFVKRNQARWKHFETVLDDPDQTPDQLSELFIYLTDDLAYARTYYPNSRTTAYLNHVALRVHRSIYQNKKEATSRLRTFWQSEISLVVFRQRAALRYSLLFFVVALAIGALSAAHDETFVRLILGDAYVNETIRNIKKGDPMGIYKSMSGIASFSYIAVNNILVSFRVFVFGMLFSVGSILVLTYNGIMVGAFQYFFYEYDLLWETVLVIWIHGALEISAIVVAGGAGLALGNSLLFPGTYPRLVSLKQGAKDGLKIIIGLVPIFLFAAFLEGFVTRLTDMPTFLKLAIILSSFAFVGWYFVYYPRKIAQKEARQAENLR